MQKDKSTRDRAEKVLDAYAMKFQSYPRIPMIQCKGMYDPQYIKMLLYCIKKNKLVDESIMEKFFPTEEGVIY